MSSDLREEQEKLRAVALSNARSILLARERAERELRQAKAALERKNEELAHSLAMMRATLESTTDAVFATDGDGRITTMNEKYVQMWNIPGDGSRVAEHRHLLELVAPNFDDPAAFVDRVAEIYAEAAPESFDLLELKDGRVIQRFSCIQRIGDRDVGRVWSFRDITDRVRVERELRQQREWLETTLSSIGDAVITTDVYGRVTFMNPVAEMMTGWSLPAAAGQALEAVFDVVDEKTGEAAHNPAETVLRGGRLSAVPGRTTLRSRDGRKLAIDESAAPIRDAGGAVLGAIIVFHDVTLRRSAETALREETRALELLNKTGTAIAAQLDLQALLQTVTDAATSLSGAEFGSFFFNAEDENGDALLLYTLSGAPREAFEHLGHPRPTAVFGPTFRGEAIIRSDDITKDSRYGTMEPHRGMPAGHLPVRSYLAVPVMSRSGAVHGGLFFGHPDAGVFTERSERIVAGIAAQAAIAIDNARLFEAAQAEIASRERAENALREADRRKDEFLAILAHELRNPLAPILQAARILQSGNAGPDQEQWSHQVIDRQVRHMSLLLEDLLDVSRITRGQLNLRRQWTDLSSIVEAALETARPLLDARGHRLEVHLPTRSPPVFVDLLRVAQILANLLTNAAKYTPAGGKVSLAGDVDGDEIVVRVADTGMGIDPEMLPHIFEMFSQTKSAIDQAEGGLGIGLALVKGLAELHGGSVEVASAGQGKGSEFTVRLPRGRGEARPADEQRSPDREAANSVGRRILIADDNRDSADSLAMVLRLQGHEVTVAYDGEAAVRLFDECEPDIAVLDIGMPRLDGYEVAKRIRGRAGDRRVTLVALTGWGQESDRNRAVGAGFDFHFTKPVDTEELTRLF